MNSCEIFTHTPRFPFAYNRFSDTFIAKGNREGCPYASVLLSVLYNKVSNLL